MKVSGEVFLCFYNELQKTHAFDDEEFTFRVVII